VQGPIVAGSLTAYTVRNVLVSGNKSTFGNWEDEKVAYDDCTDNEKASCIIVHACFGRSAVFL
jgi:hypothetical protein